MYIDVSCPRCGREVVGNLGCRHLRWVPARGGPLEFARYVLSSSPYTAGRGFRADTIPLGWWESEQDWVYERITTRLEVIDGYCFGEPVDIDRLCLDIWHRFSPEPDRATPARMP